MKLKNPLILMTLVLTIVSANTYSETYVLKGEATIIVDNKTYTLPLKKCYQATNVIDGKLLKAFVVATHLSRKSKVPGPRFSAQGSKLEGETKAFFSLEVDGGFSKGGTRYKSEIPYDVFKDNKLLFDGKANSIKKENEKPIKESVPIKISVSCNK